ncbi:MAG: hypothetical protein GY906_13240 [bacterium]|nr:hypothetical protein [bacterium]
MILRIFLLVALLMPCCATAEEGDLSPAPFLFPIPDGWRAETIPFPLDFAPELEFEGVEELRFAPGMFEDGDEEFWSYAFVWWVQGESVLSLGRLSDDLEIYFSGLARLVARERGIDASGAAADVQLSVPDASRNLEVDVIGKAEVFDSFVTAGKITLHVRVKQVVCAEEDRLAVILELSPQPYSHKVWTDLGVIRGGFQCEE